MVDRTTCYNDMGSTTPHMDNLSPHVKIEPTPLPPVSSEGVPFRRSSQVTVGQRQSARYVDIYLATVMADCQDDAYAYVMT
jgi:hypothetical protein